MTNYPTFPNNSTIDTVCESILKSFAEYYSKSLSREVVKGKMEVARQCKHTGGLPPIGYAVDPVTRKYVINEDERGIVEIVFSMFLTELGCSEIVSALNREGYRTRGGRLFDRHTVYHILRNEKYTGTYIYNGKHNSSSRGDDREVIRIEGGMPAIVLKSMFQDAQALFNNKTRAIGA